MSFSPTRWCVLGLSGEARQRWRRVDVYVYAASVAVVAVASRRTGCGRPSTPSKHAVSSSRQKTEPPIRNAHMSADLTGDSNSSPYQLSRSGLKLRQGGGSEPLPRGRRRVKRAIIPLFPPPNTYNIRTLYLYRNTLRPPTTALLDSRTASRETKQFGKIWVLVYWRAI